MQSSTATSAVRPDRACHGARVGYQSVPAVRRLAVRRGRHRAHAAPRAPLPDGRAVPALHADGPARGRRRRSRPCWRGIGGSAASCSPNGATGPSGWSLPPRSASRSRIGVVGRSLLGYHAADLSLAGPFLAGLIAGPYAGAIVGIMVGLPGRARRRARRAPLLDRLRLRRRRPARDLSEGSDLALLAVRLHRPPSLRLAVPAPLPDRLAGPADRAAGRCSSCCASGSATAGPGGSSCSSAKTR